MTLNQQSSIQALLESLSADDRPIAVAELTAALEEEDYLNLADLVLAYQEDLKTAGFKFGLIRKVELVLRSIFLDKPSFMFPSVTAAPTVPQSAAVTANSGKAKWILYRGPYQNPGSALVIDIIVSIASSWPPLKAVAPHAQQIWYINLSGNALDVSFQFHPFEMQVMASRFAELWPHATLAEELDWLFLGMVFRRNWTKGDYGPNFPFVISPKLDSMFANGNPEAKSLAKLKRVPRIEASKFLYKALPPFMHFQVPHLYHTFGTNWLLGTRDLEIELVQQHAAPMTGLFAQSAPTDMRSADETAADAQRQVQEAAREKAAREEAEKLELQAMQAAGMVQYRPRGGLWQVTVVDLKTTARRLKVKPLAKIRELIKAGHDTEEMRGNTGVYYTFRKAVPTEAPSEVPEVPDSVAQAAEDVNQAQADGSNSRSRSPTPELFIIERILDKRVVGTMVQYLVAWEGYTEADNSWEPRESLMERRGDGAMVEMDEVKEFENAREYEARRLNTISRNREELQRVMGASVHVADSTDNLIATLPNLLPPGAQQNSCTIALAKMQNRLSVNEACQRRSSRSKKRSAAPELVRSSPRKAGKSKISFAIGERVLAIYQAARSSGERFQGVITGQNANGSYSVTYDDGDKEAKVLLKHIYKLNVRMLDADPSI